MAVCYKKGIVRRLDLEPQTEESLGLTDSEEEYVPSGQEVTSSSDNTANASTFVSPRKRKRKKHSNRWARNVKKRKINSGQGYKNQAGKMKQAAKMGEDCRCPKKCFDKVHKEIRTKLFSDFWQLADYNLQNSYLASCLCITTTKRKYTKEENSRRKNTCTYKVKITGNLHTNVCKKAFLSFFGLQHHRGRVENLQKKLSTDGCTTPPQDQRGRHQNRPNNANDEDITFLKLHIESFPAYDCHYSRRSGNTMRKYLGADLNITKMVELYKEKCQDTERVPLSADQYRRILCSNYNIGFKEPSLDTCNVCDEFIAKIGSATSEDEKTELQSSHKVHLSKADSVAKSMADMKQKAIDDPDEYQVIALDLQQALPTPKISTNVAFYKRKLWVYNLTIHDCATKRGYMYVWPEHVAKRGSDEITSCLWAFINSLEKRATHLYIYTDNCSGQNKNMTMVSFLIALVSSAYYETITHIMPPPGHTRLPCDSDQAIIEKQQSKHQFIYTPDDWISIIAKSKRSKPTFITKRMQRDDFYSISHFSKSLTKRKIAADGTELRFKDACSFRYGAGADTTDVQFKYSYGGIENWHEISYRKRGSKPKFDFANLPLKYQTYVSITKEKYADLMCLLPYIPPIHHSYFQSIPFENSN